MNWLSLKHEVGGILLRLVAVVEDVLHGLNVAWLGAGHQQSVAGQGMFKLGADVGAVLKIKKKIIEKTLSFTFFLILENPRNSFKFLNSGTWTLPRKPVRSGWRSWRWWIFKKQFSKVKKKFWHFVNTLLRKHSYFLLIKMFCFLSESLIGTNGWFSNRRS